MTTNERIEFDISICPTDLDMGGEPLVDGELLLEKIRETAEEKWPDCTFRTLQIGHRQGDAWQHAWVNGEQDDDLAHHLVTELVDWSDESIYEDLPQGPDCRHCGSRESLEQEDGGKHICSACAAREDVDAIADSEDAWNG